MNWKYYDRIILKKLKSRSKTTKSPSLKKKVSKQTKVQPKDFASLLFKPILINLDDLFVTSQNKTSEKNKQESNRGEKTTVTSQGRTFVRSRRKMLGFSDGKTADESCNSCDVTINSTSSDVNACGDVANQSFVTSEQSALDVSNVSADSGMGFINDSMSES